MAYERDAGNMGFPHRLRNGEYFAWRPGQDSRASFAGLRSQAQLGREPPTLVSTPPARFWFT